MIPYPDSGAFALGSIGSSSIEDAGRHGAHAERGDGDCAGAQAPSECGHDPPLLGGQLPRERNLEPAELTIVFLIHKW